MNNFTIYANEYLKINIQGFYHTQYTGYRNIGNPDYLNDLKNTFNNFSETKLFNAKQELKNILKQDLFSFPKHLVICVVPRAKAQCNYTSNQLLFKKSVQEIIIDLSFIDGTNTIIRENNTKTTHLAHTQYGGDGDLPYPGITKNTCKISNNIIGKDILLIDDIYTNGVNVDEDVIQALIDKGAKSVVFYSIGKAS